MREIKFRAWHKEMGMSGPFVLGSHPEWEGYTLPYWSMVSAIMQYTGMKDKDGVEIYERDFVRLPSGRIEQIFERLGCWFISMCCELGYYEQDIEVIGNIYENPELLEGK